MSSSRILVLVGVVLLLVAAGVAALVILSTGGFSGAGTTSTDAAPQGGTPPTSATSGPRWVSVPTPDFPGRPDAVAVSEEALVVSTAKGLYASMIDGRAVGPPAKLPATGPKAGYPSLDGTLAAWWEGTPSQGSSAFVDQTIYAMRLPDGAPAKVVGADRDPYYPQVSGDHLTWVQPKPAEDDPTGQVWAQPIYRVSIRRDGSPRGEPQLLTSAPRAFVGGASRWAYSFDGSFLAWEQNQAAEGLEAGVYLMDLGTRQITKLAWTGGRPSLAGPVVTYFGEALDALDVTTRTSWTIDTRGDWATASDDFVVYLRGVRRQTYREVVAHRFVDESEQILGRLEAHPLAAATLAASRNHIAYVGDDGKVRLFEWLPAG